MWPRLFVCGVGMHVHCVDCLYDKLFVYFINLSISSTLSLGGETFASLLENSYPIESFIDSSFCYSSVVGMGFIQA